jgi:hypothetical protein
MVPGSSAVTSHSDVSQQLPQSIDLASLPPLTLADDSPTVAQIKMGRLGQVVKGGGTGGSRRENPKRVVEVEAVEAGPVQVIIPAQPIVVWYLAAVLLNKLADRHLALILSKYYSSTHLENYFIDVGFKTLELAHRY